MDGHEKALCDQAQGRQRLYCLSHLPKQLLIIQLVVLRGFPQLGPHKGAGIEQAAAIDQEVGQDREPGMFTVIGGGSFGNLPLSLHDKQLLGKAADEIALPRLQQMDDALHPGLPVLAHDALAHNLQAPQIAQDGRDFCRLLRDLRIQEVQGAVIAFEPPRQCATVQEFDDQLALYIGFLQDL